MSYSQFVLLFCLAVVSFAHADNDDSILDKGKNVLNDIKGGIEDTGNKVEDFVSEKVDHVKEKIGLDNASATLNISFVTTMMALFHAYFI